MKNRTEFIPDSELPVVPEMLNETNDMEEINNFIERTKLQNKILRRLTENLRQQTGIIEHNEEKE